MQFILGIFANGHLKMEHERSKEPSGMPSLAEMTEKALQVLKKNSNGYILVVITKQSQLKYWFEMYKIYLAGGRRNDRFCTSQRSC